MKKYYCMVEIKQGVCRKIRVTWDYLPVTTNTFGNTDADDTYVWVKPYGSPESERFTIEKSLLIEE